MRNFGLALISLAVLFAGGCATAGSYLPVLDASLAGGKIATQAAEAYAVSQKDVTACYVTGAFSAAFGVTQQTVDGWVGANSVGVIPGVDIDVSSCLQLAGGSSAIISSQVEQDVNIASGAVMGGITAILAGSNISCKDRAIAHAVLTYLQNLATNLGDQLASPTGKFSLPSVSLDISQCPPPPPPSAAASKVKLLKVHR